LLVFRYKLLLGAMQEHPEILPVYAKLIANLVFISLLKENRAQQLAIFGRQLGHHPLYLFPGLRRQKQSIRGRRLIGRISLQIVERAKACA
jgi:hypothetical protein